MRAAQSQVQGGPAALAELCRLYWYPIYVFARRRGHSPEDARDLTQEFFVRLLVRESLANADPDRGKFRSFILGAMNYFLADERAKLQTQKRGGGHKILSLDLMAAEQRFDLEPAEFGVDLRSVHLQGNIDAACELTITPLDAVIVLTVSSAFSVKR